MYQYFSVFSSLTALLPLSSSSLVLSLFALARSVYATISMCLLYRAAQQKKTPQQQTRGREKKKKKCKLFVLLRRFDSRVSQCIETNSSTLARLSLPPLLVARVRTRQKMHFLDDFAVTQLSSQTRIKLIHLHNEAMDICC